MIDRASYVQYFRTLATEHVGVNTFVYGPVERLLRASSTDLDYPVVMLAIPDVVILPDDGGERYESTLLFLTSAANDEAEENAAVEAMYWVARDFHQRMKHDARFGDFMYAGGNEVSFQVKTRTTLDNTWGIVLDFDVTLRGEGCYDPAKFGA